MFPTWSLSQVAIIIIPSTEMAKWEGLRNQGRFAESWQYLCSEATDLEHVSSHTISPNFYFSLTMIFFNWYICHSIVVYFMTDISYSSFCGQFAIFFFFFLSLSLSLSLFSLYECVCLSIFLSLQKYKVTLSIESSHFYTLKIETQNVAMIFQIFWNII